MHPSARHSVTPRLLRHSIYYYHSHCTDEETEVCPRSHSRDAKQAISPAPSLPHAPERVGSGRAGRVGTYRPARRGRGPRWKVRERWSGRESLWGLGRTVEMPAGLPRHELLKDPWVLPHGRFFSPDWLVTHMGPGPSEHRSWLTWPLRPKTQPGPDVCLLILKVTPG